MVEHADERLAERLAAIRARHPGAEPVMVAEVVHAVLATMSGDLSAQETSLLAEVEALGHTISCAKAEIAALRVDDITDNHIPFATDELDAIVEHTATATNAILTSCETLDSVAGGMTGESAAKLQDATTRIYEACSFQDITGQRITKVVGTLKFIETHIVCMMEIWGGLEAFKGIEAEQMAKREGDARLLNGPKVAGETGHASQDDIDALFA